MVTVIVVCVTIFVIILCGGFYLYDRHRKANWLMMNRNEIIYDQCENLPYGADHRVHVEEEMSL